MGVIRLEGAGTRRFLHGQSSQAIELAPEGACLATCLISPTGRMRALALGGELQGLLSAADRALGRLGVSARTLWMTPINE
mgnify:CR=1 FL=1